ncbi:MAG TPA: hypothetical protein VFO70_08080 [Chitinophagaceae bacterium]|nr:hypothetical protein [Chitinophagaceae bacterium]HEX5651535.1 hypothetical protein [Chitinophagaceae bacterium]
MRICLLIVPALLSFADSIAQDTVSVVEKSIKVAAMSPLTEYYGFAAGDKVIFDFWVEKGKEIKDLSISEYPNSVKFAQHTVEKIENKILEIPRNGIYKFEYYNSTILPRIINIRIQRIPHSPATKTFNTNVKWVDRVDTARHQQDADYQLRSDTSFREVLQTTIKVNQKTSADNTHRSVVEFTLPANTVRWAYWIGVGEAGKKSFEEDQKKYSGQGIQVFNSGSPLAGVLMGSTGMTQIKVGENIRYFFISKPEETQKFLAGAGFGQFKQGDMVADYALMNYSNKNPQKYYLGLSNNSQVQPVEVGIRIVAIVVEKSYETKKENVEVLSTQRVPVHEQ